MKRKILKIIGIIILLVVASAGTLIIYARKMLPDISLEDIHVTATPERIHRGEYLFNYVAVCVDCHSARNEKLFSMPVVAGTEGGGGELFDQHRGFPGSYTAKNLTPYHLSGWTDAEIFRAITSGENREGRALFPIMPYQSYGKMDKEDVYSIISYLRTLKPIPNEWPASQSDFPMSIIINTIPKPADLRPAPPSSDAVRYGKYLVSIANCMHCHTQMERGELKKGLEFAGGREFPMPTGGTVRSANITADVETGIGAWSREAFVQKFRSMGDSTFHPFEIQKGGMNTIMPWTNFGKMKENDLAAIYAFLRTVKPIRNKVQKFTATAEQ